jgi:hypothetical protein
MTFLRFAISAGHHAQLCAADGLLTVRKLNYAEVGRQELSQRSGVAPHLQGHQRDSGVNRTSASMGLVVPMIVTERAHASG